MWRKAGIKTGAETSSNEGRDRLMVGPSSAAVKDGNDPVYCNGQSMVGSPFVPFAIILLFPNE